ncbi:vitelline envelope sperm lysin receptor-like [Haliotis asinina]|uniref:vitelline envelope sperm lysin receptor-like n=1 Tax=Haliotis asinina TaxID=109174 RepID=UPI003531F916
MAGLMFSLFALLLGFSCSLAKIPDGYIMLVTPECGPDGIKDGRVKVTTDLRAEAKAVCRDNKEVAFTKAAQGVNLELPVSYALSGSSPCKFQKRKDARVYVVKVLVSWGEPGNPVHSDDEEFFVTCTFDDNGNQISPNQTVDESLVAPLEIQTHNGKKAVSTFSLVLTDVLGAHLTNKNVPLGRKVVLTASTDGKNKEKGLRPDGCDAIGTLTGRRYSILRAGCGDGVVFSQKQGFVTNGLTSMSPYFSAFDMAGEPSIRFECNFTLCEKVCDGSSCANERRRRSEDDDDDDPHLLISDDQGLSWYDLRDSSNDLVFWALLLGIGILTLMSVGVSVCALTRRRSHLQVVAA